MPNRRDHDHLTDHNWQLEIEGVTTGAFAEVSGLDSETEIIEYQDGNDLILRKRPGRTKYSNITLKRGYINNTELWDWRKAVMDGKIERKSGSVILAGDDGSEVMRYNFFEAWPAKWKGFSLNGKGNSAMTEEIEMVVERLERG